LLPTDHLSNFASKKRRHCLWPDTPRAKRSVAYPLLLLKTTFFFYCTPIRRQLSCDEQGNTEQYSSEGDRGGGDSVGVRLSRWGHRVAVRRFALREVAIPGSARSSNWIDISFLFVTLIASLTSEEHRHVVRQ
jgi:hypothetical protein